MAFDVNNPYFRTKVLTATPEQLQLMLIEGAIHFVELGQDGLTTKDWEGVYENLSQAKAILFEIVKNLKPEIEPDLCGKMASLYNFMIIEITTASFQKDASRLEKVIQLLEYERETWRLLIEKAAAERGETPSDAKAAPPTPAADAQRDTAMGGSLSISA